MAKAFFTPLQQEQIIQTIKEAELNTSGEIRLHVEANCNQDPYLRATHLFYELNMQNTALANGVLFYLAYADRKFAIVGDKGIHEKVSQQFWDEEKELMLHHFKSDQFTEGICLAIKKAGEKLKHFFPYDSNDTNELSNEISFGGSHHE